MWSANIVLLAIGIPIFLKAVRESTLLSLTLKPRTRGRAARTGAQP